MIVFLFHHYLLSFHHVHALVEADVLIALHHASESRASGYVVDGNDALFGRYDADAAVRGKCVHVGEVVRIDVADGC